MNRTLALESLKKIGERIQLQGWVHTIRDHGKLVFIELRDRSGLVQVVGDQKLGKVHPEDVIEVTGTVAKRPEAMINPEHATGTVEVEAESVATLNTAKELPLPIGTDGRDISEEIRLKYRYLDLRRPRLHNIIKLRSQFIQACRHYLFEQQFTEIETPLLTKSTKEGSRDFIIPSRLHPGKFFALPQSPQQYKQLLMTAGFERYFQIAKCVRDEDLRADRGFEHTQIDMEMSFVTRDEVMQTTENMFTQVYEKLGAKLKHKPFKRISYTDCIKQYGADKFDDRTEEEKQTGVLSFAWVVDFPFFKRVDTNDPAEVRDGKSGWTFTHNPFSMPNPEHLADHLAGRNIDRIITQQYDLVCNGYEVGGGSIRAHKPEILRATFKIMGYSDQEIEANIGHMLEAFSFGTPPHGGIAPGVDRLLMVLTHENALRETVAFPQTASGKTAVFDAPTNLPEDQLKELGIQVRSMATGATGALSVLDRIQRALNAEGVSYHLMSHIAVHTSEEAAQVRGTKLEEGAKALVLKADDKPIMVIVSAAQKLDLKAIKQLCGFKDVSMADKDLLKAVTGLEPGAVPPFGSLFKIPTYVDEQFTKFKQMNFNAGSHTHSIQMAVEDFMRLEKPTVGSFAKG